MVGAWSSQQLLRCFVREATGGLANDAKTIWATKILHKYSGCTCWQRLTRKPLDDEKEAGRAKAAEDGSESIKTTLLTTSIPSFYCLGYHES